MTLRGSGDRKERFSLLPETEFAGDIQSGPITPFVQACPWEPVMSISLSGCSFIFYPGSRRGQVGLQSTDD